MSNYYDLLAVDTRASTDDIKRAFRERAKELHPDANPAGGPELRQQFAELAEAYEVLRDSERRAQYDAARSSAAFRGGPGGFPKGGGAYSQPGVSEDAFEAAFRRWWEKAGAEWQRLAEREHANASRDAWQQRAEREHRHCKSSAEQQMAAAAAWEAEKADATRAKVRYERVKRRTQQARAARQAATLRGMWQTKAVSWVDFAVAAAATAAAAGVFAMWQPILRPAGTAAAAAAAEEPD